MRALLALLPFALVPLLLATGRVGALASGVAGLLAALVAAALLQPAGVVHGSVQATSVA